MLFRRRWSVPPPRSGSSLSRVWKRYREVSKKCWAMTIGGKQFLRRRRGNVRFQRRAIAPNKVGRSHDGERVPSQRFHPPPLLLLFWIPPLPWRMPSPRCSSTPNASLKLSTDGCGHVDHRWNRARDALPVITYSSRDHVRSIKKRKIRIDVECVGGLDQTPATKPQFVLGGVAQIQNQETCGDERKQADGGNRDAKCRRTNAGARRLTMSQFCGEATTSLAAVARTTDRG